MSSTLLLRHSIALPPHPKGDYDHGDVSLATGQVFIANTAAGSVEVVDGAQLRHLVTIPGCPEVSGVLVAQEEGLIFAAARGAGKLLLCPAPASLCVSAQLSRRCLRGKRGAVND